MKIFVKGGNGGNGLNAFHKLGRIKSIPCGGNGGNGGDVYIQCKSSIFNLIKIDLRDLRIHKIHINGENGKNGKGSSCHGSNGNPMIIDVPVGTVIKKYNPENDEYEFMTDLLKENNLIRLAYGGKGGRGNSDLKRKKHLEAEVYLLIYREV